MILPVVVTAGLRRLIVAFLRWTLGAFANPVQAEPAGQTDWQFTPLAETVVAPPRWFIGTDGPVHLLYELD